MFTANLWEMLHIRENSGAAAVSTLMCLPEWCRFNCYEKKETQKKILEFCFFICYDNQCMESRYLERSPCKYFTRRIAALLIELEAQIL